MKRKVIHVLLSAIIAFGLWVYVVTVVSPESEATFYNVPVVLNNESVLSDKGLMIVSENPPTLTLKLKGNRSDLNELKSSDIAVIADLSRINAPGKQTLNYSISFPGNASFTVLNQNPAVLTLDVVEWATKEVNVSVVYTGTLAQDYIDFRDNAVLSHNKITLTGPKEVVDKIAVARIDVNLTNQKETISKSYRYTLCDTKGNPVDVAQVKTSVAEINLTLKIYRVKEIPVVVDAIYGGGATRENTKIEWDFKTIKIAGSEKLLAGLDSLIVGPVNLAEMTDDMVMKDLPINLPEGVVNLTGAKEVKVTIKFSNLAHKTLSVKKITAMPSTIPSGMTVENIAKVCEVTVRGTKEQIDAITEEHIQIQVDLTGGELGEGRYKAVVSVDTKYGSVGVVGSYSIYVRLTNAGAA